MNVPLRDIGPEAEAPVTKQTPQVFKRALVTPPGAPWEQERVAKLDAVHGAPLPIGELMHQVRRLDRWGPGRPGRYAAFYVRAREYREPFETTVDVDGQSVRVRFGSAAPDLRRLQSVSAVLLVLGMTGAVLGAGLMLALNARSEATAGLQADEAMVAAGLKQAQAERRRADEARDLKALTAGARPLDDVVGDITWIATSKTPEAHLLGVHWERGLLAVEARGEQPPFLAVDRPLERSAKPLRAGVWLWGVGQPDSGGRHPVAAELRP